MEADTDVRTLEMMKRQLAAAEAEWQAEPNEPGKLMKLVEILRKTEQPEYENRAIELLAQKGLPARQEQGEKQQPSGNRSPR